MAYIQYNLRNGGIYMNKYLRERRRLDEFDEDVYSEGYLEDEESDEEADWEKWWMVGYLDAEKEWN